MEEQPATSLLDLAGESVSRPGDADHDQDQRRSTLEENEQDDDIDPEELEAFLREEQQRQQHLAELEQPPPQRRGGANTGAKSVLADYAEAKEKARLRRQAQAEAFYLRLKEKTITIRPSTNKNEEEEEKDENEDEDDKKTLDPDDEDFIKLYREKRLQELQAGQRKTFGHLQSIAPEEFVAEIDSEIESGAFVLIHLFKNYLAMCVRMNHVLQILAQKHPYVKVMKIVSTEADANYNDAALPTLLIYHKGELARSLIRITDELPEGWDQDDVEALLRKYGVLPAPRKI